MVISKVRKLKSLSKFVKGDGGFFIVRVLVVLIVRFYWVKMVFLVFFYFFGLVKRNWYGVYGLKKTVKVRRGFVRSIENRLGFAFI